MEGETKHEQANFLRYGKFPALGDLLLPVWQSTCRAMGVPQKMCEARLFHSGCPGMHAMRRRGPPARGASQHSPGLPDHTEISGSGTAHKDEKEEKK